MLSQFVRGVNRLLGAFDCRLVRASRLAQMQPAAPHVPDAQRPTTFRAQVNVEAPVSALHRLLDEPLNLLLLGSSGDSVPLPRGLSDKVRIFSLDAVAPAVGDSVVPINGVIAPSTDEVTFIERVATGGSSIAAPDQSLIDAYGLQDFYREKRRITTRGTTVNQVAAKHNVSRWHLFKSDLEGLDYGVVSSVGDSIRGSLVAQMELRFQPFYSGEPDFHVAVGWMKEHGFSLLDVQVERWRYLTANRMLPTRGRATFCDAIFVNDDLVQPVDVLFQAVLLGGLGYVNYAEHRLLSVRQALPEASAEVLEYLFSAMRQKPQFLPYAGMPHIVTGAPD